MNPSLYLSATIWAIGYLYTLGMGIHQLWTENTNALVAGSTKTQEVVGSLVAIFLFVGVALFMWPLYLGFIVKEK